MASTSDGAAEESVKMALEYCVTMQKMIDTTIRSLQGFRALPLSERVRSLIRDSEKHLIVMFSKQLVQKTKLNLKEMPECLRDYPRIKQWLEVVGLPKNVIQNLLSNGLDIDQMFNMPPDHLNVKLENAGATNTHTTIFNRSLGKLHAWTESQMNGEGHPEPSIPLNIGNRSGNNGSYSSCSRPNSSSSSHSRSSASSLSSSEVLNSNINTQPLPTLASSPTPSSDGDVFVDQLRFQQPDYVEPTQKPSKSFPTTPPPNRRINNRVVSPLSESQISQVLPLDTPGGKSSQCSSPLFNHQGRGGGGSLGLRMQHTFQTKMLVASKCQHCKSMIRSKGRYCEKCRFKCHKNCEQHVSMYSCTFSDQYVSRSHQNSPCHSRGSTLERFVSSNSSSSASTPSSVPYGNSSISSGGTHFSFPTVPQPSPAAIKKQQWPVKTPPTKEVNVIDSVESNDSVATVVGSDVSEKTLSDQLPDEEVKATESASRSKSPSVAAMVRQTSVGPALQEWDIEFSELALTSVIGETRSGIVHRGYWHGDVIVKTLPIHTDAGDIDRELLASFKQEVADLKKVRHENLVLFMGACMNPPDLAVVTSFLNGVSLYAAVRKVNIADDRKLAIASQIVQGMAYLHSKKIVHKDLTSKNIYLDKERVTIAEFGLSSLGKIILSIKSKAHGNAKSIGLKASGSWLCYLAPELMKSLSVNGSWTTLPYTKHTDVYAFGSIWYEIISGDWPFSHVETSATLIWLVGNGAKPPLHHMLATKEVKDILMRCWTYQPNSRPSFSDLCTLFEKVPKKKLTRSPSQPINSSRSYECGF